VEGNEGDKRLLCYRCEAECEMCELLVHASGY
jgi:hypothetical protein